MSALWMPAQPVDATQALNLSAGVSNCKVSRGRSFIRQLDYRPEPAAVRLVFWPCSVVQPVPGLFVGPTGNSVALAGSMWSDRLDCRSSDANGPCRQDRDGF